MVAVLVGLLTFVAGALAGYLLSGSSPVAGSKPAKPGSSRAGSAADRPFPEDARKIISEEAQDLLDIAIAQSISTVRQSRDADDTALKAEA